MNETICRLCLQTISNDNCQIIAETWVKTLKLNLKISKETVMCVECADCLQVLSKFTSGRIYKGDGKLPLSDIQNDVKLDLVKTEEECNFCTEICRREALVLLNESKGNKFLASMLERCISETNLKNTEELLTCGTCLDALQGVSSFILKCLEVEEKISEYIELEGTDDKGQIELKEVQQYMCRPILKLDMESDVVNKLEERSDQVQEGGNTIVGGEIKHEQEISHPELVFKLKYADIKLEQTDCDITDIKSEQSDCDGFQEPFIEDKIPNDPTHELVVTSNLRKYKERIFYCKIHSYKTKHKGHWKSHLLLHKSPSELKMSKCEYCSFETKYKGNLKLHLSTHKTPSELEMFKCEVCSFETKRKDGLKLHLLTHKSPSELEMFKCAVCSYESKRKVCLKQHLLTHKSPSELKMFKCELCSYEAKRKDSLKEHSLMHKSPSELKMFKCEYCSFEAKRKGILRSHILTHKSPSELKMFKCELCPYEAKRKDRLKEHLVIHKSPSELKIFKCEYCSFEAKRKRILNSHLFTHTSPSELKMFKCE